MPRIVDGELHGILLRSSYCVMPPNCIDRQGSLAYTFPTLENS